eukprot:TRINITY_DN2491_c0_g1_i1.p1 TRINITY_DN2491_c0_g1~~TRINITY_DN2491_c0_g1_i1.p1  ORF type:complete len:385 (+),score=28.58 TRINITY_DN2491_c0_g1_i1:166-1320(+)
MYHYVNKFITCLFLLQVLADFLNICCAPRKLQDSVTVPKRIYDINYNAVAPKEKTLSMQFSREYKLQIDISNIDQSYAALCVITKDDDINDTKEFLDYHFKIGIGRIYLFDTGSNNLHQLKIFEALSKYLSDGRLFYSYWNYGPARIGFNMQIDIYNKCAHSFAKNHVWLGFIDTDEFIVLRNPEKNFENNKKRSKNSYYDDSSKWNNFGDPYIADFSKKRINGEEKTNIQQFLMQYEDYGALTMNWVLFGSSGHEKHQYSALKSYTKCLLHDHVKTFVNVRFWNKRISNVHYIAPKYFLKNRFAVDENFERVRGPINKKFAAHKIAVFHYVTKSREDYQVKMKRGDASGHQVRKMVFYDFVNNNANYTCTEGTQLYNKLFNTV